MSVFGFVELFVYVFNYIQQNKSTITEYFKNNGTTGNSPEVSYKTSVAHWSWLLGDNLIYSLFVIGWFMESSWMRPLWCQSHRYLDLGDLTQLPNFLVKNTLSVGMIFVISPYLLFLIFHVLIVIVDTLV